MMKNFKLKTMEMTRQIRDEHYHLLRAKSATERIAFYRQQAQEMLAAVEVMKPSKPKPRKLKPA